MRVGGPGGVEVRLGSGALGLVLDRLGSLLEGRYWYQYQYLWSYRLSAWTGAVGRSLVGAVKLVTVSKYVVKVAEKTHIKPRSMGV